jgi:GT2 family glycosyltransferase
MNTVLSVVIPTFRRKESLQRLLGKLLNQEEVSPEIIVVDQNPPGYLGDILSAFPSIGHLILPEPNASDARNRGFMASTGQHILFIDDDLVPEADFCRRALDVFRYPEINGFSPLVYNAEGRELALHQAAAKRIGSPDKDHSAPFRITDTISAAVFFRRAYFEKTGGFDPLLFEFAKTAEDQEFFLRMRKKGMDLYFVPSVEIYHDEGIPGGCELRTADYWVSREKCMKSWAYRRRIHHKPPGGLGATDLFQLARSGFLNREVFSAGIKEMAKQAALLRKSIGVSAKFLRDKLDYYSQAEFIDHLGNGSRALIRNQKLNK